MFFFILMSAENVSNTMRWITIIAFFFHIIILICFLFLLFFFFLSYIRHVISQTSYRPTDQLGFVEQPFFSKIYFLQEVIFQYVQRNNKVFFMDDLFYRFTTKEKHFLKVFFLQQFIFFCAFLSCFFRNKKKCGWAGTLLCLAKAEEGFELCKT